MKIGKYLSPLALMSEVLLQGIKYNRPRRKIAERISDKKYSNIPKGHKIWNIGGINVIALNEKNAIRKAERISREMAH